MKFEDIQDIVIVYGTKESINHFLEVNSQAIDEAREEKIGLIHLNKNKNDEDFFKELRKRIWEGN